MIPCINEDKHTHEHYWDSNKKLADGVVIDHSNYKTLRNWLSDMNMYW